MSTELGIRFSFVKTSEFRVGGGCLNPQHPAGTPLVHHSLFATCDKDIIRSIQSTLEREA
jgi:hypothetical protein